MQELDQRFGLPKGAIACAIFRPYARAEAAIAKFLGVPAHHLWPSRYNSDGTRRRPQPSSNYKPATRIRATRIRHAKQMGRAA